MEVKIDTKEKFTVVTPIQPELTANIAAPLINTCSSYLQNDVKNIILNLQSVSSLDTKAAESIATLQGLFLEHNASFVLCCLQPSVMELFEQLDMLDMLNFAPTESEAWDIVQMEEIERELLGNSDHPGVG